MTPDHLARILTHALGLDERRREPWRNQYVTAEDDPDMARLVALGFMAKTRDPGFLPDGSAHFIVTDAGKVEALAANNRLNPPPKPASARYHAWLDSAEADCGVTFGEYLRRGLYRRATS